MTSRVYKLLLASVLVGPVACSGVHGDRVATERQGIGVASAALPIPIKLRKYVAPMAMNSTNLFAAVESNTQPQERDVSPSGAPIPTWSRKRADLYAADAWARCANTGVARNTTGNGVKLTAYPPDAYMSDLRKAMEANLCTTLEPGAKLDDRADDVNWYTYPTKPDTARVWLASRETPACNVNDTTGSPSAIAPLNRNLAAPYASMNWSPTAQFGLSSPAGQIYVDSAMSGAVREMDLADVNLCMAGQLREALNGPEALFGSATDLLYLQNLARDRAQLAVVQYANLAKVLSAPAGYSKVLDSSTGYLVALRAWADSMATTTQSDGTSYAALLGRDFVLATQMLIDSTTEMSNLLARRASAGWATDAPAFTSLGQTSGFVTGDGQRPARDWGVGSSRARLMNLLYGGEPLGGIDDGSWPNMPGGIPSTRLNTLFVRESTAEPQVAALMGFVRRVKTEQGSSLRGALQLRPAAASSPTPAQLLTDVNAPLKYIDEEGSAVRLYRRVEVDLRRRDCASRGVTLNCDEAFLWQQLPPAATLPSLAASKGAYWLFQTYNVEPRHALALVRAVAQSLGSLLTTPATGNTFRRPWLNNKSQVTGWSFGDTTSEWLTTVYESVFHVTGAHAMVSLDPDPGDSVPSTESWFEIDPSFKIVPFGSAELASPYLIEVPWPRQVFLTGSVSDQGFGETTLTHRAGATSALAYAREAIATTSTPSAPFFTEAAQVLPAIERAIGTQTMVVRPQMELKADLHVGPVTVAGLGTPMIVDLIVPSASTSPSLVVVPTQTRALQTGAIDGTFKMFGDTLTARQRLDGVTPVSPTQISGLTAPVGVRKLLSFTFTRPIGPAADPMALFLKTGSGDTAEYQAAHTTGLTTQFGFGLFQSWGGTLNNFATQVMAVQANDWSKPAFDGFGLPTDWLPPSDASLVGGQPGEQSYTYYLRIAKEAAATATAAVQKAIDGIGDEALDQAKLTASQERTQGLAKVELSELCGSGGNCDPGFVQFSLGVDTSKCGELNIPLAGFQGIPKLLDGRLLVDVAKDYCVKESTDLSNLLGPVFVPKTSLSTDGKQLSPSFGAGGGGKFDDVLARYWTALTSLQDSISSAVLESKVSGTQIATALKEVDVATVDYDTAVANEKVPMAQQAVAGSALDLQKKALDDFEIGVASTRKKLFSEAYNQCKPEAFYDARDAGAGKGKYRRDTPDPGVENVLPPAAEQCYAQSVALQSIGGSVPKGEGLLFNCLAPPTRLKTDIPAFNAQVDRCRAAAAELTNFCDGNRDAKKARDEKEKLLVDQGLALTNLTQVQKDALVLARVAASNRVDAAQARVGEAHEQAGAKSLSVTSQILERVRALTLLNAEIAQIQLQAQNSAARAELEKGLSQMEARAKSGLQRKFRNYDLWRAKALLESARRLAAAARRSIESRFVVDLSEVTSDQAFVAAPSTWADEIFDADLSAPSVVGLSASGAKADGSVYPNRLEDYVANLERFVEGYTVAFPTAVASPDAEVISLPAPNGSLNLDAPSGVTTSLIAPESQGWSFYCPETEKWYQNPSSVTSPPSYSQVMETGVSTPATLNTLCQGRPPTLARHEFSLDPWGRLNSSVASPPFVQRHNVRWRRLAVNLVGTGIHDCSGALSKEDCYSTSFLRYAVEHTGPAWVTNNEAQWRSINIPAAFVEAGKALATEEWLDPVIKGWNLPQIAAVARGEFMGRPVGGSYSLTLQLGPEVRLDRIERVQILAETDYWTHEGDDRGIHQVGGERPAGYAPSGSSLPALVAWLSPNRGFTVDANSNVQSLADQSYGANSATQATVSAQPLRAADSGKAWLSFDGTNDVLAMSDSTSIRAGARGTIGVWVRPKTLAKQEEILGQWGGAVKGYYLRKEANNDLTFIMDSSGGAGTSQVNATAPAFFGDTDWHFVTVEWNLSGLSNAERLRISRDGVDQTLSFSPTMPAVVVPNQFPDATGNWSIGTGSGAAGSFFSGRLGAVYLLNDSISFGDRQGLMALESPVAPWTPRQEDSLVGWWSPSKDFRLETDGTVSVVGDMGVFNNDAVQNTAALRPARVIDSGAPALAFTSGTAKNLVVADSTSLSWTQKGTYAFWARVDASQDFYLLDQTQGGLPTTRLNVRYINDSSVAVQLNGTAFEGTASIAGRSDYRNWHFYVLQFDGTATGNANRLKLFIDGVPKTITVTTGAVPALLSDPSSMVPLTIGDYRPAGFNGRIGSVYVFNNVLDDTKRSLLMEYEAPYSKPVPMSALNVWMDPSLGVTKVGTTTQVSSWANQGLVGSSLTASGTVSLGSNIGGQSTMSFAGGANFLTGTLTGVVPAASDATVIMVAKPTSATPLGGLRALLDLQPTNAATNQCISLFHYAQTLPGQMIFRAVSSTGDATVTYSDFGTPHVLVGRHTTARRDFWVDGKASGSNLNSFSVAAANYLRLGGQFNSPPFDYVGDMGDVFVWPRALSNAEINRVTQYLSTKYQIPVTTLP